MKQIEIKCRNCGKTLNLTWHDEKEIELLPYYQSINWPYGDKGIVYMTCLKCM